MLKHSSFLFLVICFSLSGCVSKTSDRDAIGKSSTSNFDEQWARSFVESINAKFSQQLAAGDSAALAAHYWPDAELLLDNSEPVKGKDIINAWGGAIRMGMKEINLSTTGIKGDSLFIIETGNYQMKDAKGSSLDKGKYVVVWEQRNGEWKLYRDIGSTSMPVARP
jgi:ketosteroid isomerase-like protein